MPGALGRTHARGWWGGGGGARNRLTFSSRERLGAFLHATRPHFVQKIHTHTQKYKNLSRPYIVGALIWMPGMPSLVGYRSRRSMGANPSPKPTFSIRLFVL